MIAGPQHATALAELHRQVFADEAWPIASFVTLLGQPGVLALIDPQGGLLLLRQAADEAEILTFGVVPKRQGIGRRLLLAGISALRTRAVGALYLEVAEPNAAARGLYAACGFQEAGRRPSYYPNGADALILRLRLEPS